MQRGDHIPAILLVGPTGSGKTPLGQYLEAHGLAGRRCAHFDFGAELRAAATAGHASGITATDLSVIRNSLATGALLEDAQFPIAAKILRAFASRRQLESGGLMVLNGLPRHVGQARAMEGFIAMRAVISLECSPEVVYERIRRNSGGDRTGRVDDDVTAIARKLDLFSQRTLPLLDQYRCRAVSVLSVAIGPDTTPEEAARQIACVWRGAAPGTTVADA